VRIFAKDPDMFNLMRSISAFALIAMPLAMAADLSEVSSGKADAI
jgi:hypothetical protein